jgi:hypothetical protein
MVQYRITISLIDNNGQAMLLLGRLGRSRLRSLTGLHRNVILIALTSFFADVSSEMAYPILPLFLSETLKAPATAIGLIEGIAEAIQHGVQGFAGRLSDRRPRKKPIAVAGYALSALSKPLIGLATGWPVALTGRAADRLGAGSRSAPRDALIASSVSADARGRAFGLEGIGDNAGAFLGPLLALLLVAGLGAGYRLVFFLAFIPGLFALGLMLSVREPPQSSPPPAVAAVSARFRMSPEYRRYLLATALFGIGNSTNAFLILRLNDAGGRSPRRCSSTPASIWSPRLLRTRPAPRPTAGVANRCSWEVSPSSPPSMSGLPRGRASGCSCRCSRATVSTRAPTARSARRSPATSCRPNFAPPVSAGTRRRSA